MDYTFMARQPIFDKEYNIFSYELLFRDSDDSQNCANIKDDTYATAKVLNETLNTIGLKKIFNDAKICFINVGDTFVKDVILESINKEKFIFEILETTILNNEIVNRIKKLHKLGYKFAIDDISSYSQLKNYEKIFKYLDYIKVDILEVDNISSLTKQFLPLKQKYNFKLLAEKVETKQEYELCKKLGYDYFQGYFFARPEIIKERSVDTTNLAVMKVINLLKQDRPIKEIEETLNNTPSLVFKLLKFLNTSTFGFRTEIASIKQAISLLGRIHLANWLTLMLYSSSKKNHCREILYIAIFRATLMQKLFFKYESDEDKISIYYFVGLLSALDILFDKDMKDILQDISLSKDINKALIENKGSIGEALGEVLNIEYDLLKSEEKIVIRDSCNTKEYRTYISESVQVAIDKLYDF